MGRNCRVRSIASKRYMIITFNFSYFSIVVFELATMKEIYGLDSAAVVGSQLESSYKCIGEAHEDKRCYKNVKSFVKLDQILWRIGPHSRGRRPFVSRLVFQCQRALGKQGPYKPGEFYAGKTQCKDSMGKYSGKCLADDHVASVITVLRFHRFFFRVPPPSPVTKPPTRRLCSVLTSVRDLLVSTSATADGNLRSLGFWPV